MYVSFAVEAVWANEVLDIEELAELDGALEADVDEFGKVEENEVTLFSKHICKERNVHYVGGRCMKSNCNHLCKNDGYKKGKCHKSKSDQVTKCYCFKHCEKPAVPINPVISPSSAPVNSPVDIPPSSAPTNYPGYIPPSSAPDDTPAYFAPTQAPTSYKYFEDEEADIIFT